jgi:hypothetical protein
VCDDLLQQPLNLANALSHTLVAPEVLLNFAWVCAAAPRPHDLRSFRHQPPEFLRLRLGMATLPAEYVPNVSGNFARKGANKPRRSDDLGELPAHV